MSFFSHQTETEELLDIESDTESCKSLILYNDDFNTFEFVIDTLVKICKHERIQAEQCAYIVHYNGKCSIKVGTYHKLEPMCIALLEHGLSAQIE